MKKTYENIKKLFESNISVGFLYGIGAVIIAVLIFSAGISVGFHKASFGRDWGENYERNFGMAPEHPILGEDNFPNANGAIGKIISIELPTIIVQDKNNIEKVILLKDEDDVKIQKMMTNIKTTDLVVGDYVIVIGSPNSQGEIEAKFIRVMPEGMPVLPTEGQAPAPAGATAGVVPTK